MVGTTEKLATELLRIVGGNGNYQQRVDAMSEELLRHDETTARTALMVALACSSPRSSEEWRASR